MRVANSPESFQQKMNDLFHGFEFIPANIDELLVLKKGESSYHVQNLELTLNKLKKKRLKCNIQRYLFGQTKI